MAAGPSVEPTITVDQEWRSLPAWPAVEVALPALEDGALQDLAALRAGDLPHQVLQQHQASAGDLLTWAKISLSVILFVRNLMTGTDIDQPRPYLAFTFIIVKHSDCENK